jgi:putative tryptophan/tyrosine transport system substrate-binding protein
MRMDTRWGENDIDRARRYAAELVAFAPDVILASGSVSVSALQHVTRTLPIVFAAVGDPVGIGLVDSLARPGGNVTGFMNFEYSLSGKWLELLKQIAPRVTRAAVLRNPAICGQRALIALSRWMTAPSVATPRSAKKLKKAKQLSGTASASSKSRFMAKCVCLWLPLASPSGFAALWLRRQLNFSPP